MSHMYETDDRKPLKVSLPIRQHIRLRTLKLLTEQTISEITEDAVESYFEALGDAEDLDDDHLLSQ